MAKKKLTPKSATTILALKRLTPVPTEQVAVSDFTPIVAPLPEKPSIEVAEHTPERQVKEPLPKFPPLVELASTTNARGEVFEVGDQIVVRAPWGGRMFAQITLIYQGREGAWAQYKPIGSMRQGWQWERGVVIAALLIRG